MDNQAETKKVVSVAEMAKMVGLSRARLYQLQRAGVFPWPIYDVKTRRPFFTEDMQQVCLEVRRRNCGINGKPILFYAKPLAPPGPKPKKARTPAPKNRHSDLVDALAALGLTSVTGAQVGTALKELFPNGTDGMDQAEIVRAVFLRLKRQDSGDKVGR